RGKAAEGCNPGTRRHRSLLRFHRASRSHRAAPCALCEAGRPRECSRRHGLRHRHARRPSLDLLGEVRSDGGRRPPRDPILFHHGIGASAGIWTEWIAALADRHPIVTFDMRGYGRSIIPPPDFRWSLEQFIADVFAVADAAGFQRFHLVGESIGGTIALAAALARPERIATLTVSNGGHLGASIQRVDEWRRQLDEGGVKRWSDIFMRDRFHDDALAPERWAWFASQQEA